MLFPKFTPKTPLERDTPAKVAKEAKVPDLRPETLATLATLAGQPPSRDIENCLDPALIVAVIEAASRTSALDGIALEHFARAAVNVNHILAEVPPGRRAEAGALVSRTWTAAAHLIRGFHYFDAYQVIDGLPAKIQKYLPQ